MLWVRPEREQPCFARRQLEQQRQQRAVRQSQQQQPEQRQQQHWVPLCEGIREGAGGNTCPLRAGGVRESTDFRSVPSESPPDAACFPWRLPGERIRRSHRGW